MLYKINRVGVAGAGGEEYKSWVLGDNVVDDDRLTLFGKDATVTTLQNPGVAQLCRFVSAE